MGTALGATVAGVDYQSLYFWREVGRLLNADSFVSEVSFERRPQGYDDLWVIYKSPIKNCDKDIIGEYYQFKWHVNQGGEIGYKDLVDPKFIGTKSTTVLSNALAYYQTKNTPPEQSLYLFVTPWHFKSNDPLHKFVENRGGRIRLDLLFKGGPRSDAAKVRTLWKKELGITSDADLRKLLQSFRLVTGGTYEELRKSVSDSLARHGLQPLASDVSSDPYFSLYKNMLREGRTLFTPESFRVYCTSEKLFAKPKQLQEKKLGVRSFLPNAENIFEETDECVDFADYFKDRHIKDPKHWATDIRPKLESFLPQNFPKDNKLGLYLSAHSSIAFLIGDIIGLKNQCPISIYQRTQTGTYTWTSDDPYDPKTSAKIQQNAVELESTSDSKDLIVSIAIAQETMPYVEEYLENEQLEAHSILDFHFECGPTRDAIESGKHAFDIATQIANTVRTYKVKKRLGRDATIHIFAAAPNAFMVFLGQLRSTIGNIQLYEFDLEGQDNGSYKPAMRLE